MSENLPGPADPRTTSDPAAVRPDGVMRGTGESIVVQKVEPGRRAAQTSDEEPEVFASTVRRKPQSEAGYNANPPRVGRLGVILGTVLAVLLVGSGITLWATHSGSDDSSSVADAASTPSEPAPSAPAQSAPASPPPPAPEPVPAIKDTAAVLPDVSGAVGKKASIALPKAQPDGTFVVKTISEGDGPVVAKNAWVTTSYTAKDWTTGKDIPGSYDKGARPQLLQVGMGQLIPALDSTLVGKKVGSRVLVVAPPAAAFGAQGNSALKIGAKDTLVFVVDISDVVGADLQASGEETAPPADMPQVKENGKAAATITVPKGVPAPKALKTAVLIKGSGPKVTAGEQVVVQYTGALYSNGKKFDSSWDHGGAFGFQVGAGAVIPGWDQGIVGQTVGSRLELVIPSALAYGPAGSPPTIPANAPLVFVVDILAAG